MGLHSNELYAKSRGCAVIWKEFSTDTARTRKRFLQNFYNLSTTSPGLLLRIEFESFEETYGVTDGN